jgi:hypothetical protein
MFSSGKVIYILRANHLYFKSSPSTQKSCVCRVLRDCVDQLVIRQTRITPTVCPAADGQALAYRPRFAHHHPTASPKRQEMGDPTTWLLEWMRPPQRPHTAYQRAAASTKAPHTAAPPKALAGPPPNPTARMTWERTGKTSGKPSLILKALRIPRETFPSLCTLAA